MKNPTASEIDERTKQMRLEDTWVNEMLEEIIRILKEMDGEHNQQTQRDPT